MLHYITHSHPYACKCSAAENRYRLASKGLKQNSSTLFHKLHNILARCQHTCFWVRQLPAPVGCCSTRTASVPIARITYDLVASAVLNDRNVCKIRSSQHGIGKHESLVNTNHFCLDRPKTVSTVNVDFHLPQMLFSGYPKTLYYYGITVPLIQIYAAQSLTVSQKDKTKRNLSCQSRLLVNFIHRTN